MRSALGYEPQYPLEKGVADYMKWLVSRLTKVAQAMKAKRRSKSPEEINAALAAKKGPGLEIHRAELSPL